MKSPKPPVPVRLYDVYSLRDYFAAKALAGLCVTEQPFGPKEAAERAYLIADAMLEARK